MKCECTCRTDSLKEQSTFSHNLLYQFSFHNPEELQVSTTFMVLCWKSCPELFLDTSDSSLYGITKRSTEASAEVSSKGIFAYHHYSALKTTFGRTDTLDKGEASSSKYRCLNSPLLCPWILLCENKIIYLIFSWRIIVSFLIHCKFVFKDTCQHSAKSHSFSFLNFANLLT